MIEFRFFGDVSADGFDQSDLEVLEHDYLALFDNEHVARRFMVWATHANPHSLHPLDKDHIVNTLIHSKNAGFKVDVEGLKRFCKFRLGWGDIMIRFFVNANKCKRIRKGAWDSPEKFWRVGWY